MLDRDTLLKIIDDAYAARVRGDMDEVARYWAPDGTYAMAGAGSVHKALGLHDPQPMEVIGALMARFTFSDLERIDALVDGNKAAILWEVTATCGDHPPVRTQLMDLIELDDEGRVRSFLQFADTAEIQRITLATA